MNRNQLLGIYKKVYNLNYISPSTVYIDDSLCYEIAEILSEYSEVDRQILFRRLGKIKKQSYEQIGKAFGMTAQEAETSEVLMTVSLKPKLPPIIISKSHARHVEQLIQVMENTGPTPALRMELFEEVLSPYKSSILAKNYYAKILQLNDIELDYYTKKVLRERGVETLEDLLNYSGKKIGGLKGVYVTRLVDTVHSFGYTDFRLAS